MSETPHVERRRAVRMRPLVELPATARLLGPETHLLEVWDVSVGGLAVVGGPGLDVLQPGTRARVALDVGRYGSFELEVEVRHRGGSDDPGIIGMQLVAPAAPVTSALGRYVAELLERGASS